jgi:predicted  nucleic acid-binding Zn-ribbon protein
LAVPIDADTLKAERDRLKDALRELETEQRKLDTELKKLRQREIRTKREIEALGTLIAMQDTEGGAGGGDEPA